MITIILRVFTKYLNRCASATIPLIFIVILREIQKRILDHTQAVLLDYHNQWSGRNTDATNKRNILTLF